MPKTKTKEVVEKAIDDELLEAYKKQNPTKYAAKLAAGEFKKAVGLVAVFAFIVASVVGFSYAVRAYTSGGDAPKVVIENGNYIEASTPDMGSSEPVMGAMSSPYSVNPMVCTNNDCVYTAWQSFATATTTIISIPDPFRAATSSASDVVIFTDDGGQGYTGATATVSMARLNFTGKTTTTLSFVCGAAANPQIAPSIELISSGQMVTGTTGMVENNLSAALGASVNGGTVAKIALNSTYPYFNCVVSPSSSAYFVSTTINNTFGGNASVRFNRTQY